MQELQYLVGLGGKQLFKPDFGASSNHNLSAKCALLTAAPCVWHLIMYYETMS